MPVRIAVRPGRGSRGHGVPSTKGREAPWPGAATGLYERFGRLAYKEALRIVRDPRRAEEVVQDCLLKLWRSSGRFDADRGSVRTWVLTSVRHRAIDYLRGRYVHQRRERELPTDAQAGGLAADPWGHVASLVDRSAFTRRWPACPRSSGRRWSWPISRATGIPRSRTCRGCR
jgi:hypothetical protein